MKTTTGEAENPQQSRHKIHISRHHHNMKLINLTPHTVNICNEAGEIIKSYPSEGQARVSVENLPAGEIDGVPVVRTVYGEPDALPESQDNVFYIVSMVYAQQRPHRRDLIMPNTAPGQVVRDSAGQIIGVKSFSVATK